ncbi:hypothetical protein Trydic_g895 [Trypoxylus dichotomus]
MKDTSQKLHSDGSQLVPEGDSNCVALLTADEINEQTCYGCHTCTKRGNSNTFLSISQLPVKESVAYYVNFK